MAPEIRIELILRTSKAPVLPLHHSGINYNKFLKNSVYCNRTKDSGNHYVVLKQQTKNPRFFRSRVLCLESFLELFYPSHPSSTQNPVVIAHELSAQFIVRYSSCSVKGLWDMRDTFFFLKFNICVLYRNFLALASGFLKLFFKSVKK